MEKRELDILSEHFSGDELKSAAARVDAGEPLAYVIGEWYFYGLTFMLDESCLVPQPDTEHIVDRAIRLLPPGGRFIDLGCGSGCIALSVLAHRTDCTALLCDISPRALDMAERNAQKLGLDARCAFACADMKTDFAAPGERFDAVISNPPYIRSDVIDTLSAQVLAEPRAALDGGEDGMDFYRAIFDIWLPRTADGGFLALEIGYDQADGITALAGRHGCSCEIFRDYGGNDRVAVCRAAR